MDDENRESRDRESINIIEKLVEKAKPDLVVFGNHDSEEGFHTESQMMQNMEYPNCLSNLNDADVYGCGNCCVTIRNSAGDKDAFAIWLIDSNYYQRNSQGGLSYDCVHDDQIDWYEKRAAELKAANGGAPLPSILFRHMPVQQMCGGLSLYQTLGAGYFTYGEERGGRLIVLDENNLENIYTESIEVERITATEI